MSSCTDSVLAITVILTSFTFKNNIINVVNFAINLINLISRSNRNIVEFKANVSARSLFQSFRRINEKVWGVISCTLYWKLFLSAPKHFHSFQFYRNQQRIAINSGTILIAIPSWYLPVFLDFPQELNWVSRWLNRFFLCEIEKKMKFISPIMDRSITEISTVWIID